MTWANTFGLIAVVAFVAVTFTAVMRLSTRLAGTGDLAARSAAGQFAHSMIPIAADYVIAHCFSLLVFNGQQALILASDPLVDGANLFGTAGHVVDYRPISLSTISLVQVAAVVIGPTSSAPSPHTTTPPSCSPNPSSAASCHRWPSWSDTLGGLALLFSA